MHKMPKVVKQTPKRPALELTPEHVRELTKVTCPECDGNVFQKAFYLLEVPLTHPGNHTAQSHTIPAELFICAKCKTPVKTLF